MLKYDLVVFSHLRWDFVYQRPQHLLSRAAQERRVVFVEEPILGSTSVPNLELRRDDSGVLVAVPHLPEGTSETDAQGMVGRLATRLLEQEGVRDFVLWFYSPMFLPATQQLRPRAIVYDCMDELANFKNAPEVLHQRERELFACADLVFTGGHSLWEAKRDHHANCHCLPSSVDVPHFARARQGLPEPHDLNGVARPRAGFFGVIDERMDLCLLEGVATILPWVQFVMVGPVVKIDPLELPQHQNILYLGPKAYKELPAYLAHWDAAMMPFALNDATRFISPTKTPEYLAAGKPVVSTPIRDVVRPYGERDLVLIGHDAPSFAAALECAINDNHAERLARADDFLATMSWDLTWRKMEDLISRAVMDRARSRLIPRHVPVPPRPAAAVTMTPPPQRPTVRTGAFGAISDLPARTTVSLVGPVKTAARDVLERDPKRSGERDTNRSGLGATASVTPPVTGSDAKQGN